MGITTRATLPPHVRVGDVATVLAALAGAPIHKQELRGGGYSAWCEFSKVEPSVVPEMALVSVNVPGSTLITCNYHFEGDGGMGEHVISASYSDRNRALLLNLVRFFGGQYDASDCDAVDCDLFVSVDNATWPCPRSPDDGEDWDRFQDAILAVRPVVPAKVLEDEQPYECEACGTTVVPDTADVSGHCPCTSSGRHLRHLGIARLKS